MALAGWSQRRRLVTVLLINLVMLAAQVVVGLVSHSVGVLASAGDTVADLLALSLGLIAIMVRDRDPDHERAHWPIAIAASVNSFALFVVSGFVVYHSIHRLLHGVPEVLGLPMVIVSAISTVVFMTGAWVIATGGGADDVHMRSVLLDSIADSAAAAGVAAAGLVIVVTGRFMWIDAVVALVISAVVVVAALTLLRRALSELGAGRPRHSA